MDQAIMENGGQQVELLSAINDDHGGVIVEMKEPMDSMVFGTLLRASMLQWTRQGKKGVWIKLPIELVNLVETVVKEGFWYHHAEPHYLMLVYWIPKTANTIPANATHRARVGAIVMNDKRELLVVQEKSGKLQGTGVWKIPTGVVDEGEDIFAAAIREVKEETAIDTEFVEVLAFRESHKVFFEKSDLFFLCMLHPLSFNIQKQELEIEAAQVINLSTSDRRVSFLVLKNHNGYVTYSTNINRQHNEATSMKRYRCFLFSSLELNLCLSLSFLFLLQYQFILISI
ncbi:hypothetical protein F0562_009968 [Nyssa sinensis]|uniref:Nudix hydrolase domain-containing protein n=1 Tax=Nyssa sinensis TaxID=561372 RepID=A0A5J4ZXK4_9ASTE|nr:hypothetical protein F0562_009968 [Nyssa sinensis]